MENTAKVYMNGDTLAQRINARILELAMNKAALALRLGIHRSTVSQYLNGKYNSDPTEIERKMEQFLIDTETQVTNHDKVCNYKERTKEDG